MATKSDLVAHIADLHHVPQAGARAVVDNVLGFIAQRAAEGEKVTLKGFGTFEVRGTKAHTGRNPRTGEPVEIAASSRLAFRAASKKAGA